MVPEMVIFGLSAKWHLEENGIKQTITLLQNDQTMYYMSKNMEDVAILSLRGGGSAAGGGEATAK